MLPPHGTTKRYWRGCRCRYCKRAYSVQARLYYAWRTEHQRRHRVAYNRDYNFWRVNNQERIDELLTRDHLGTTAEGTLHDIGLCRHHEPDSLSVGRWR